MTEIEIPYHLVIPIAISLLFLAPILANRKTLIVKYELLTLTSMVFLLTFSIQTGFDLFETIYWKLALNDFDLNNDGFFSGAELTTEQAVAMKKVTSNTARNFSFRSALFSAFLSSFLVFIVYGKRKRVAKEKLS